MVGNNCFGPTNSSKRWSSIRNTSVTTFDRFWKIIVVNKFEDDKALGNHQTLWIELISIRDMF